MRFRSPIAWLLTAAALIAAPGCGEDEPDPEPTGGGPLVVYERSGGIAGVYERLEIERDGAATLTVGITDRSRTEFRLSDAELEQLSAELEAADFEAVESGDAEGCADCFSLGVDYAGRETTIVAEVDEPPETVSTVLASLGGLVASHHPELAERP